MSEHEVSTDARSIRSALADFVALNDPATRRRVERDGNYFVVEGVVALERLLSLPDWHVRQIAVLPKVAERLGLASGPFAARTAVVDEAALRTVVGFDLHRGALASVDRRSAVPIESVVADGSIVVAAEGINDHENLGSLYRNAAAFGASAVVLDDTSADPFYRRSVRVSQGNVLSVPTASLGNAPTGIEHLRNLGVTVLALTPNGDVELTELTAAELGTGPLAVLVGAEGPGLSAAALAAADHRVAIRVQPGVDSVNVATAAAIALHHVDAERSTRS